MATARRPWALLSGPRILPRVSSYVGWPYFATGSARSPVGRRARAACLKLGPEVLSVVVAASDSTVRPANYPPAPPVHPAGHPPASPVYPASDPSTVSVIRLIKVCQRIVWIDLLNNFGRFTLRQGLAIVKVLRTAGNFGLRDGIGPTYAQPHGYCAADPYNGQTDQKRASGKVSFSAAGVFNVGCFVLEINAHRGPPNFYRWAQLGAPDVGDEVPRAACIVGCHRGQIGSRWFLGNRGSPCSSQRSGSGQNAKNSH
jgi:hypothetical protein